MIRRRKWKSLTLNAVEVDISLRMSLGKQVEGEHSELVSPAGGIGPGVEANPGPLLRTSRGAQRVRGVAPEVEVVGRHAVLAPQERGEPAPGSHAVEAE